MEPRAKAAARSKRQLVGLEKGSAKKGKAESSSSDSWDHECDGDEGTDVEMVDACRTAKKADGFKSAKKAHIIPLYPLKGVTQLDPSDGYEGSKTVYVSNLSLQVERSDVENFFKGAGKIVDVWFVLNEYQMFFGNAYVEFATAEAAQKAVELNGQILYGHHVKLLLDSVLWLDSRWLDNRLGLRDTK